MALRDPFTGFMSASSAPGARSTIILADSTLSGPEPPIRNATLKNCSLNNVTIYNSTLEDCVIVGSFSVLTECSISESVLNDVKLYDCSIFNNTSVSTSTLKDCSARKSTFIGCKLHSTIAKRCCIQDGTIIHCGIENSSVVSIDEHCVVQNSHFNTCDFQNKNCARSKLHQCIGLSQTVSAF